MVSPNLFSLLFFLLLTISGSSSAAVVELSRSSLTVASSDSSTAIDVSNGTSTLITRDWGKDCSSKPGKDVGDAGSCKCWPKQGTSSNTKHIHAAVNAFCTDVSALTWTMGFSEQYYKTYTNDDDTDVLLLKFGSTGDTDLMLCRNAVSISVDQCTKAFSHVKGHCDTTGNGLKTVTRVNWGGSGADPCYEYTIDPNPNGDITTASGLLKLPAELRNYIYRLALVSDDPIGLLDREWHGRMSLLRANQQLRKETTDIFFGENTFILAIKICTAKKTVKGLQCLDSKQAMLIPAVSVVFEACSHVTEDINAIEETAYYLDSYSIPLKYLWEGYQRLGSEVAQALIGAGLEVRRIDCRRFEGGESWSMVRDCGRKAIYAMQKHLQKAAAGDGH
ncbi:hypothetical protein LTR85_005843 [Meristemomyces frigidus]|nr:hypothetical protein LTR85_005843 [Meristemomyces frigidus]